MTTGILYMYYYYYHLLYKLIQKIHTHTSITLHTNYPHHKNNIDYIKTQTHTHKVKISFYTVTPEILT